MVAIYWGKVNDTFAAGSGVHSVRLLCYGPSGNEQAMNQAHPSQANTCSQQLQELSESSETCSLPEAQSISEEVFQQSVL